MNDKATGLLADAAQRKVLAHMKHFKLVGDALSGGAAGYLSKHEESQKAGGWKQDFLRNLSETTMGLHQELAKVPGEVLDTFAGGQ